MGVGSAREAIDRFAASTEAERWRALTPVVEGAHAARDRAFLVQLVRGLAARPPELPQGFVDAALDTALRGLLLIPGPEALGAFLALARDPATLAPLPRALPDGRARVAAHLLAHAQPDEALAGAVEQHGDNAAVAGILAAWAQERVVRGARLAGDPAIERFWAKLRDRGHPLAWLPLRPLAVERDIAHIFLPPTMRAVGGWGYGGPSPIGPSPAPPGALPSALAVDDPAGVARIEAAFEISTTISNGKTETKVFFLDPPARPEAIGPELLRSLPLDCLDGAEEIVVSPISPEGAYGALFWAASNGGDLNPTRSGAYGRLGAFRSLAGLAGTAADLPPEQVEEAARRAAFAHVKATSEWFYKVIFDLALAVLRPSGEELVVTAWTDSD